jgi:hypothetical protein
MNFGYTGPTCSFMPGPVSPTLRMLPTSSLRPIQLLSNDWRVLMVVSPGRGFSSSYVTASAMLWQLFRLARGHSPEAVN